jgi:hypothetical protein
MYKITQNKWEQIMVSLSRDERQTSVCMLCSNSSSIFFCANSFNSGPPGRRRPTQIHLGEAQMSNWIRRCKDGRGPSHLDCEWSLIWSSDRFALLFHSKASHPTYFFISFRSSSWLVSKKTRTLVGDSQHVLTSARCEFSSLHEFAYFILPIFYWSGLIYFKEVSVPVEAQNLNQYTNTINQGTSAWTLVV